MTSENTLLHKKSNLRGRGLSRTALQFLLQFYSFYSFIKNCCTLLWGSTFPSQQVTYFLHPHVSLCVYLTLYLTFPHSLSFSVYLSPEAGTCGLRAGHATKHGGEKSSSVSSPFNCLYPSPSLPPSPPRGGLGDN